MAAHKLTAQAAHNRSLSRPDHSPDDPRIEWRLLPQVLYHAHNLVIPGNCVDTEAQFFYQ